MKRGGKEGKRKKNNARDPLKIVHKKKKRRGVAVWTSMKRKKERQKEGFSFLLSFPLLLVVYNQPAHMAVHLLIHDGIWLFIEFCTSVAGRRVWVNRVYS